MINFERTILEYFQQQIGGIIKEYADGSLALLENHTTYKNYLKRWCIEIRPSSADEYLIWVWCDILYKANLCCNINNPTCFEEVIELINKHIVRRTNEISKQLGVV